MGRWVVHGALLVVAGCGRLHFDGVADPTGGTDSAVDADPSLGCAATVWGPLVHQTMLASTAEDWEPTLTADGLHIVFSTGRGTGSQLYYASRAGIDDLFGAPTAFAPEINIANDDSYAPHLTADGRLEFQHSPIVGGTAHIASVSIDLSSGTPQLGTVTDIETDPPGQQIVETPSDLERFFTVISGNGVIARLAYQTRATTSSAWVNATLPSSFNDAGASSSDVDGWASYDVTRHELWWERRRGGKAMIASASRPGEGMPFDPQVTVHAELGPSGDPALDGNGLAIAIGSGDLPASMGASNDIYTATRTCQ